MSEEHISYSIDDENRFRLVCGVNDEHLSALAALLDGKVFSYGNEIIYAEPSKPKQLLFKNVIEEADALARSGKEVTAEQLENLFFAVRDRKTFALQLMKTEKIVPAPKAVVTPRTVRQAELIHTLENYEMTFAVGPAGTGKTFIAVTHAMQTLAEKAVRKIVLTRPVVEAGENLGFLPGDLQQKINPYLRPIYDVLERFLPQETVKLYEEKKIIEVIPLAYMRGRSLDNAYIILDEAQNATVEQMKMFLTRIGENSKTVVTGDDTQIDLDKRRQSGLVDALTTLSGIDDIAFIRFRREDVIRNRLVKKIVEAYEKNGRR